MDIMIDIETLGVKPGCVVIEIAAVAFDASNWATFTGMISCRIDRHAYPISFTTDPATFSWWERQPDDLRRRAFGGTLDPGSAITRVASMINRIAPEGTDVRFWAKSPSFDMAILEPIFTEIADVPVPWNFRNVFDVRTAEQFLPKGEQPSAPTRSHDALSDCEAQVRTVRRAFANMMA